MKMQVWHGSHARFNEFESSFIGSGRGDAPLGWGFYFAENRNVAEQFARLALKASGTGFLYRVELQVSEHELIHLGDKDDAQSRRFLLSQYDSRRQSAGSDVYAKMLRFANSHAVVATDNTGEAVVLCVSPERIAIKEVLAPSPSSSAWVAA